MRSGRINFCVLLTAVGVGLLMTGPVFAQSVQFGNALIKVADSEGDTIFHVNDSDVIFGGSGTDTDLTAWEDGGDQTLWFNTSVAQLSLGGPDAAGTIVMRTTSSATGAILGGNGDLTLGGGTQDGDLILKDTDGATTTFYADGSLGDLTLGAQGVAGDDGDLYLRASDGTTNNIWLDGSGANVTLGTASGTSDGNLYLYDGSGAFGIYLRGSLGRIVNKLSGNGLVKAWAQINNDGTVSSCYNCSTSASDTARIGTGVYEVDFTFATDITTRPVVCSSGHTGYVFAAGSQIACVGRSDDASSILVSIRNSSGDFVDSRFTAIVF